MDGGAVLVILTENYANDGSVVNYRTSGPWGTVRHRQANERLTDVPVLRAIRFAYRC